MQSQQYKHWYYHHLNGTTYLVSKVLIPFFCHYFSNSFHCLPSIMLGYFNFFLLVVTNWNGPTSLFSAKDISYWYHTQPWSFFKYSFTRIGLTVNIFPSVKSWCVYIISSQKRHSIIGCLVQSLLCLMYHRHLYTP